MIAAHERVVIDLGTGSGQAVLRRARQYPNELVIGVDADAAAMADASRRAAASPRRGGLPNAMFLVAPAEELPGALAGTADELVVALPWGSLLRGILDTDVALLEKMRACLRARGEMELLLSTTARDGQRGLSLENAPDAACLAARFAVLGLDVREWRGADESDVTRLSSSWAKRLGIPARRPAWFFSLRSGPPVRAGERVRRCCRDRADARAACATVTAD